MCITISLMLAMSMLQARRQDPQTPPSDTGSKYWVYVGTAAHNGAPSKKLYVCSFDANSGKLKVEGLVAETDNPGFLAVHPNKRYLYAVNELGEFRGQKTGAVSSFRVDAVTGRLQFLNQVPSLGANPAYVTVDPAGHFAIVASYYGGIVTLPIAQDGSLGAPAGMARERGRGFNPARQEASHPHAVVLSPDNRFAIAVDLGLDRLSVYNFDERTGVLAKNHPAFTQASPGSGPRHLVFSPDHGFAYVVNELQSSISVYRYDAEKGVFHILQTLPTLPGDFKGENTGAEVQISPSGRFVYVSNRGHDSIAVFAVDPSRGTITPVQDAMTGGKTPRHFVFDPTGSFLLVGNQDSNDIVVFRVDAQSGRVTSSGEKVEVFSPACIAFVPATGTK